MGGGSDGTGGVGVRLKVKLGVGIVVRVEATPGVEVGLMCRNRAGRGRWR